MLIDFDLYILLHASVWYIAFFFFMYGKTLINLKIHNKKKYPSLALIIMIIFDEVKLIDYKKG